MIVFVGGIVGFIVISMYLPMFSIYEQDPLALIPPPRRSPRPARPPASERRSRARSGRRRSRRTAPARGRTGRRCRGMRRSRRGRRSGRGRGPGSSRRAARSAAMPIGRHRLDVGRALPVPQLAHVEVARPCRRCPRRAPAEEDVAGRLHQPLPLDHPLAVVARTRLAADVRPRAPRARASLTWRKSGSSPSRPSSSSDPGPGADAAHPDHLAGGVDEAVAARAAGGGRRAGSRGRRRMTAAAASRPAPRVDVRRSARRAARSAAGR